MTGISSRKTIFASFSTCRIEQLLIVQWVDFTQIQSIRDRTFSSMLCPIVLFVLKDKCIRSYSFSFHSSYGSHHRDLFSEYFLLPPPHPLFPVSDIYCCCCCCYCPTNIMDIYQISVAFCCRLSLCRDEKEVEIQTYFQYIVYTTRSRQDSMYSMQQMMDLNMK